ncbi:MAG: MOSC domain-containing protein [Clostridia bacterium]|nr:MOSC domain-containing protein [Clostridia bacterium]
MSDTQFTAAVITVSDKGFRGEREDTSGPALCQMLKEQGWDVIYTTIVPDEREIIKKELIICADEMRAALVLTTGGTGFSPRDVTPEATLDVIERLAPGIPEAMRAESMKITPNGCLSRETAGIRGGTLIINLPGSKKASTENFSAVIKPVRHGVEILRSSGSADCAPKAARIIAVNISEQKGTQKHSVEKIDLQVDHGIVGDAHAGNWHRQVSLLGMESVQKVQQHIDFTLQPGDFAENILTEGLTLYELPVGTKIKIGTALCEVTQIGKECHFNCAIREKAGDCVMPREGIFAKVLQPGSAKAGDWVTVVS